MNDLIEIGKFSIKTNNSTYTIYELDSYDQVWIKKHHTQKIKPNEKIFRFRTYRSYEIGKQTPLVKINTEKGLIYFLADNSKDDLIFYFETKGIKTTELKINYMNKEEIAGEVIKSIKQHGYFHTMELLQQKTGLAKQLHEQIAFNGICRTPHELESMLVYADDNQTILSQIKKED